MSVPPGQCQCGCGTPTNIAARTIATKGYVAGEPYRYAKGHKPRVAEADRFWSKVRKVPGDGCWEWTGGRLPAGYGIFNPVSVCGRRKTTTTHRYSWFIHNGPIPPGMDVCHECDNPPCIRPDHLFLETTQGNTLDKVRKGRQRKGEQINTVRLTIEQVGAIRLRYAAGELGSRRLAREYGVTKGAILAVIHRETWKHVP